MVRAELANRVQVPPPFHRPFLLRLPLRLPDPPPHGIEIKSAPQHHPRSQRHLGISNALSREALHHPPRDQGIVPRPPQPLRNELETNKKSAKTGERPRRIDRLAGDSGVEQHQRLPVDRALQMQMKFSQGHIIEVPMTAPEMEAIIGGYHGDAFSVLGPHPINSESNTDGWTIRAFLPQARSANLLSNNVAVPMRKIHPDGFYTAGLKSELPDYRIEIEHWHGGTSVMEDPYRFPPVITEFDLFLHGEGNLHEAWQTFGAHLHEIGGVAGVRFAVWAPNALNVSVTGDFDEWDARRHPMRLRTGGVWEIFIPGAKEGDSYKYMVRSKFFGHQQLKADPFGFQTEVPPKSASIICDLDSNHTWSDEEWMGARGKRQWLKEPVSIYELHLESWMRLPGGESLNYRQCAVN